VPVGSQPDPGEGVDICDVGVSHFADVDKYGCHAAATEPARQAIDERTDALGGEIRAYDHTDRPGRRSVHMDGTGTGSETHRIRCNAGSYLIWMVRRSEPGKESPPSTTDTEAAASALPTWKNPPDVATLTETVRGEPSQVVGATEPVPAA
jgi:hypothetical protein